MDKITENVIAKLASRTKRLRAGAGKLAAAGVVALSLSGCMTGGLGMFGDDKVDRSISTGTIPGKRTVQALSDEATVRNAISSADLSKLDGATIPWANTTTGSAGLVTAIREERSDGMLCRGFETTRHSYQGIATYKGTACAFANGEWQLTEFNQR